MNRKRITWRTAERLSNSAADFEYLANNLAAEGYENESHGVRKVSAMLGNIGRDMRAKYFSDYDL